MFVCSRDIGTSGFDCRWLFSLTKLALKIAKTGFTLPHAYPNTRKTFGDGHRV